jgi:ParB family chromosome partitioning protein
MAQKRKLALGRGLDALISTAPVVKTQGSSSINEIDIDTIHPNPNQPRREFDPAALKDLSHSIKEIGIVQPITLRKVEDENYQIIAGERRFRASQMAGLETIPAYIRTVDDEEVMEMALVENIQREDLNAVEVALAYQHLIEEYNLTQDQLSQRIGKNRTTIANYLRLLKLPATIQVGLKNKKIDMGHARALLSLDNPKIQIKLYEETVEHSYSVRKVEELVKALSLGENIISEGKKITPPKKQLSSEYVSLKNNLSDLFHTKVQFTCSDKGKGKISIPFKNEKDLEHIVDLLDKLRNNE